MNNSEEIRAGLETFIAADKFVKYQHLQPAVENSTEETKTFVNAEMNACCTQLLLQLKQATITDADLKETVRNSLEKMEDHPLDTEDREFCYELYGQIGDILGIDVEDNSISMDEKLLQQLEKLAKNAGINLKDFLPPNSI